MCERSEREDGWKVEGAADPQSKKQMTGSIQHGSAMLDRKMAIYTIQVCGWKGHIGETNQRRDQRPQRKKQMTGSIQHGECHIG